MRSDEDKRPYRLSGSIEIRLIEECSELIHAICKAERFGIDLYHPSDYEPSNRERICEEIKDVERLISEWRAKYD